VLGFSVGITQQRVINTSQDNIVCRAAVMLVLRGFYWHLSVGLNSIYLSKTCNTFIYRRTPVSSEILGTFYCWWNLVRDRFAI